MTITEENGGRGQLCRQNVTHQDMHDGVGKFLFSGGKKIKLIATENRSVIARGGSGVQNG